MYENRSNWAWAQVREQGIKGYIDAREASSPITRALLHPYIQGIVQ